MSSDTGAQPTGSSAGVALLGRGMTHRARPQTVLARRWSPVGSIGAVGRSSVGFGLAVGRSRSIRPTVEVGDLNSAALRPPIEFWRSEAPRDDAAPAQTVPAATGPTMSPAQANRAPDAAAGHRVDTDGAQRLASAASTKPVARRPSGPTIPTSRRLAAPARPTWTDQVIQRSSIGSVRLVTGSPPSASEVPDDFVSSGDSKVDALRLLLRSQQAPDPRLGTPRPAQGAAPRRAAPAADHPTVVRGDTTAGASTGPGRFARSIRPEIVDPSSDTAGGVRRTASADAQLPTAGSSTPSPAGRPSSRGLPTAGQRRAAGSAAAPSRVESLRALLVEQGILAGDDAADAPATASPAELPTASGPDTGRTSGPGRRSAPRRSSDDDGQAATPTVRRAAEGPMVRRSASTGESGPSASGMPTVPAGQGASSPTPRSDGGGTTPAGSGTAAGEPRTATGEAATASVRSAAARAGANDLRIQRMLALSGVETAPGRPDGSADQLDGSADQLATDRSIEAASTELGGDSRVFGRRSESPAESPAASPARMSPGSVTGSAGRAVARRHRLPWTNDRPELASAVDLLRRTERTSVTAGVSVTGRASAPDVSTVGHGTQVDGPSGDVTNLRRVTLPRALSTHHRPERTIARRSAVPPTGRPAAERGAGGAPTIAPAIAPADSPGGHAAPGGGTPIVAPPASGASSARSSVGSTGGSASSATVQRRVDAPTEAIADTATDTATDAASEPTTDTASELIADVAPGSLGGPAGSEGRRDTARRAAARPTPPAIDRDRGVPVGLPAVEDGTTYSGSREAPTTVAASPARSVRVSASAPGGQGVQRSVDGGAIGEPSSAPTVRRAVPMSVAGPGALLGVVRRSRRSGDATTTEARPAVSTPGSPAGRPPAPGPVSAVAAASATVISSVAHQDVGAPTPDARPGPRESAGPGSPPGIDVAPVADRPPNSTRATTDLADRFMTELSQTVQRRPAPLPMPFRPMADVISPGRRVLLSTDDASRKALRSVGKVAATTGDTIHLDPAPIAPRRLDEVVAHELTHVAHPSPTPRFFDDVDDSPEERRAEEVAKIMTSSPIAPGNSRPQPAVQRSPEPDVIRRSPAATTSSSATSASVSAESMVSRIRGQNSGDTVQRWARGTAPTGPRPAAAPTIGTRAESAVESGGRADVAAYLDSDAGKAWFEKMLRSNASLLMSLLEDRIIVEAERRGGRTWRSS